MHFFSFFFMFWPHQAACGILMPQPGIEPVPPASEGRILTTGLPGKSQKNVHSSRLPRWLCGKLSAFSLGDPGLIPGSGKSPGEGNGNPFQYSWLGNSMDAGAWWPIVHGVAKSQTRLSDFTFTFRSHLAILNLYTLNKTVRVSMVCL